MSKETLVLLPGLLCDDAVWVHQRQSMGQRVDTVVPNYAELGSIEGMARKVLAEVTAPVFSLAGHSMGGRVALEVVRLAPQRVRRLALLDTGYEPIAAGEAGAQEREKRMRLLQHAKAHGMREMGKLWAPGMVHPERLESPLFNEILDMIERRSNSKRKLMLCWVVPMRARCCANCTAQPHLFVAAKMPGAPMRDTRR